MQVSQQKAVDAVVSFLDGELAKIPNPLNRFATMFAVGAMASNPASFAEKAQALGIVTPQGMIDTDLVRSGFQMAFKNGNTVDLFGLTFSQSDGDELLRHLER